MEIQFSQLLSFTQQSVHSASHEATKNEEPFIQQKKS